MVLDNNQNYVNSNNKEQQQDISCTKKSGAQSRMYERKNKSKL